MSDAFHIEIVTIDHKRIALQHDGRTIRIVGRNGWAEYYVRIEEARLREKRGRQRPCLCCGVSFASHGPHNRMCQDCRRRG